MKTIYQHGKEFESCECCDKELTFDNPGLRLMHVEGNKRYIAHVCKECFNGFSYQEIVRDLSNKYGMTIRPFPQMQD